MPTLKERIRGDALLEAISNGKLASILKSFGDAQEMDRMAQGRFSLMTLSGQNGSLCEEPKPRVPYSLNFRYT